MLSVSVDKRKKPASSQIRRKERETVSAVKMSSAQTSKSAV